MNTFIKSYKRPGAGIEVNCNVVITHIPNWVNRRRELRNSYREFLNQIGRVFSIRNGSCLVHFNFGKDALIIPLVYLKRVK